jgi:hypothetical protein
MPRQVAETVQGSLGIGVGKAEPYSLNAVSFGFYFMTLVRTKSLTGFHSSSSQ